MQVLRGADKLAGAVRSALTLGTFAGLLGMLIVFYLLCVPERRRRASGDEYPAVSAYLGTFRCLLSQQTR